MAMKNTHTTDQWFWDYPWGIFLALHYLRKGWFINYLDESLESRKVLGKDRDFFMNRIVPLIKLVKEIKMTLKSISAIFKYAVLLASLINSTDMTILRIP